MPSDYVKRSSLRYAPKSTSAFQVLCSSCQLTPTEEVLQGRGIGHIVGDRQLWILAGHTVQRRAAALQAKWRVASRRY